MSNVKDYTIDDIKSLSFRDGVRERIQIKIPASIF